MSGDKQQANGADANEDQVNGSEDVEMNDDVSNPTKTVKGGKKDGDDEMTVVVPPSKNKPASKGGKDTEINGTSDEEHDESKEPPIDPKEKAIHGM